MLKNNTKTARAQITPALTFITLQITIITQMPSTNPYNLIQPKTINKKER